MADTQKHLLLVEDEAPLREAIAEQLGDRGYRVEQADSGEAAVAKLADFAFDVIVTDLRLPGIDGSAVVETAVERYPHIIAIVVTGYGTVKDAVEAIKRGAWDFVSKPFQIDELLHALDAALEQRRLKSENAYLRAQLEERYRFEGIIGKSRSMKLLFQLLETVAPTNSTILITGETGTGKEVISRAIHQRSPRANGPFVKLHCAALAESLLESELFGHEKGSFTGAVARKDGRFQIADGGTLFLDEIGEISPSIQVKLLRFLQEHEFERVGGTQTLKVDVRVIAATNKNLKDEVAKGRFREDLFYRLNVVALEMPALRERRSDVPALARFFLDRYAKDNDKKIESIAPDAMELLVSYDWPGNVRELENAIERSVVLTTSKVLEGRALPPSIRPSLLPAGAPTIPGSTMADLEKYAILETLKSTGGSTSKAAEILGISTRTIQYRLHEYNEAPRSEVAAVTKPS